MAKNVVATFGYSLVGDGMTVNFVPPAGQFSNPNAPAPSTYLLTAGANTILCPTGVLYGVYVVPQAGSSNAKTLKGVTGDTGILMSVTGGYAFVSLTPSVASFVIASVGGETIELFWD